MDPLRVLRRAWALSVRRPLGSRTHRAITPRPSSARGGDLDAALSRLLATHSGRFRQQTAQTCGTSSLAMFRALTDPDFAARLLAVPPGSAAEVWRRLETTLHRTTNRPRGSTGGSLSVPWPMAFGTPPWGLTRALGELTGRRYRVARIDGTSPREVERMLAQTAAATAGGSPVPWYVGNRVLPRHVALVVAVTDTHVALYDPALGSRRVVARGAVADAQAGIGGWNVLWAAILPV